MKLPPIDCTRQISGAEWQPVPGEIISYDDTVYIVGMQDGFNRPSVLLWQFNTPCVFMEPRAEFIANEDSLVLSGRRCTIVPGKMASEGFPDTRFTFRRQKILAPIQRWGIGVKLRDVYAPVVGQDDAWVGRGRSRYVIRNARRHFYLDAPSTTHNSFVWALRLAAELSAKQEEREPTDADYHGIPAYENPYPEVWPVEPFDVVLRRDAPHARDEAQPWAGINVTYASIANRGYSTTGTTHQTLDF